VWPFLKLGFIFCMIFQMKMAVFFPFLFWSFLVTDGTTWASFISIASHYSYKYRILLAQDNRSRERDKVFWMASGKLRMKTESKNKRL
jgi:hypothetical protein